MERQNPSLGGPGSCEKSTTEQSNSRKPTTTCQVPPPGQDEQGQGREAPRPKIKDPLGLLAKWVYLGQIIKAAHHGGELAAAYVIADCANEHGVAWPSQGTIAKRSGLSVRSTRDAVHRLVTAGFVEVIFPGGPGRSTRYRPKLELAFEEGSLLKNNPDEEGSLLKRPASPDAEADFSNMRKVASSDPVLPRLQGAGEIREDPCGQGGGPAAAPGLVVEEEEAAAQVPVPDLEIVLRRMHARHVALLPHKADPGRPAVLQVVADALQAGVTLEAIEQAHAAWCTGYRCKPNPAWDPSLATWISKRSWEAAPAKAADPKASAMVDRQDRPQVVAVPCPEWEPAECIRCSTGEVDRDGEPCPVEQCPAKALHLAAGLPVVASSCTLCGACMDEFPCPMDFRLAVRPGLPQAETPDEFGKQLRGLREALPLKGIPGLVEFLGIAGTEEETASGFTYLTGLESGAGFAPRFVFDLLEKRLGLPLPRFEEERRGIR